MNLIFKKSKVIKNQHHFKTGTGFTLIEMIVVIGIIAVISTASLASYRGSSQNSTLRLEAYTLASDLRKAQNMALGAQNFRDAVPTGGWGVYLNSSNSYVIFADVNGNGSYDVGDGACPGVIGECLQTVSLNNNVIFSPASVSDLILFIPPDPVTNIYNNGSPVTELTIQLQDNITSSIQDIEINFLGLIDILD